MSVVLASAGYPGSYTKGKKITVGNLPPSTLLSCCSSVYTNRAISDVVVFQAGTESKSGEIVTAGGRVLVATAYAPKLEEALKLVYQSVDQVSFEGKTYRRDIAHR